MCILARYSYVLVIALSIGFVGECRAAPITATLTGTISGINGGTTSDIGADVAGIVSVGDSTVMVLQYDPALAVPAPPSGDTIVYTDAILSISANLNGGALAMFYDSAAGSSLNFTWVSTGGFSAFNPVDFDYDGNSGALTGSIIPTSDAKYTGDWNPLQFVIGFSPVADNSVFPLMPNILDARLDWTAPYTDSNCTGCRQQSDISLEFTSVEFSGLGETPIPAALPLFASGLGGLGLLGWRRKRKKATRMAA